MNSQEAAATERREVTIGGKFFGLGIVGCTVIASIWIEKFGTPETQANIPYMLLGALALSIILPVLLFRRPVR